MPRPCCGRPASTSSSRARQVCCGQPAFNAGHRKAARRVAKTFVKAFSRSAPVVCPSGSCATMAAHYLPDLVGAEPLRRLGAVRLPRRAGHRAPLAATKGRRVAYHDSCHMLRELRISTPAAPPARGNRGRGDHAPASRPVLRVRRDVLGTPARALGRDGRRQARRRDRDGRRGARHRRSRLSDAPRRAGCGAAGGPAGRPPGDRARARHRRSRGRPHDRAFPAPRTLSATSRGASSQTPSSSRRSASSVRAPALASARRLGRASGRRGAPQRAHEIRMEAVRSIDRLPRGVHAGVRSARRCTSRCAPPPRRPAPTSSTSAHGTTRSSSRSRSRWRRRRSG